MSDYSTQVVARLSEKTFSGVYAGSTQLSIAEVSKLCEAEITVKRETGLNMASVYHMDRAAIFIC